SKKIAAFSVVGTELYALTSDGEVYGGTFGLAPMTFMYNSSKEYDTYAFFYSVSDGTTTHLISKTRNKNEALFVFSFPKGSTTTNVTTTNIKSGYAEYLDTADIVSALYLGSTVGVSDTLLVATNDNGLYKISINYASANSDSTANGTSTKSEEYDFTVL
ncbi:MAG: hypothetical protein VB127_01015, partial [Sphaerochaeta sp.]|nr:hypothetical protein [Sphaerochaeta sp.]